MYLVNFLFFSSLAHRIWAIAVWKSKHHWSTIGLFFLGILTRHCSASLLLDPRSWSREGLSSLKITALLLFHNCQQASATSVSKPCCGIFWGRFSLCRSRTSCADGMSIPSAAQYAWQWGTHWWCDRRFHHPHCILRITADWRFPSFVNWCSTKSFFDRGATWIIELSAEIHFSRWRQLCRRWFHPLPSGVRRWCQCPAFRCCQ